MTVKTLATFIFGVAVGAVGGYFLTREAMKTQTQLEINEMRKMYKEQYGVKDAEPTPQAKDTEKVDITDNIYEKIDTVVKDYHTESELIEGEEKKATKLLKATYSKPSIITEDEYLNDNKWAHYEFNWYYHHKVMVDITAETGDPAIVDDPYVQVGNDALEELEEGCDGIIYVRNDNRGELYQINLCAGEPIIDPETWDTPLPDDDEDIYE